MQRREFITLVGGAGAAWPLAARAQQAPMPVVGVISSGSPGAREDRLRAFHAGLNEAGYADGRNVAIEYRWAENRTERLAALAADLARRQVTVIASLAGLASAQAAKAATTTIPIVFQGAFDPVEFGLVASLSRPGANMTGISSLNMELGPKRLEILHELVPAAKVIALLVNPIHPSSEAQVRDLRLGAAAFGLEVRVAQARNDQEFDAAFASVRDMRADALVIGTGTPFVNQPEQLGALSIHYAIPTIYQTRDFATGGGLVSYGGNELDSFYQAGVYTGRVLKGEKPADLPVQQATKVEMIVNLKTAKELGIIVPLTLLGRADQVIE